MIAVRIRSATISAVDRLLTGSISLMSRPIVLSASGTGSRARRRGPPAPARRSPCQMLTWLAVSTGLPTRASSASSRSTVCSAVSGSSTASASGASALDGRGEVQHHLAGQRADLGRGDDVARRHRQHRDVVVGQELHEPARHVRRVGGADGHRGHPQRAGTRRRTRTTCSTPGTPATFSSAATCSAAPSGPNTKLPDVQAQTIESSGPPGRPRPGHRRPARRRRRCRAARRPGGRPRASRCAPAPAATSPSSSFSARG